MKQVFISTFLFVLMSMVGEKVYAYDIAVKNADGITIYYNYVNDGNDLEVTYKEVDIYNSYSGNVVIPEEVTNMDRTRKVTSIGARAFYKCSDLTSVTIPNSVTSVGYSAFGECKNLTSATISNSMTSIGAGMFYKCSKLTSVTIPNNVTSIGTQAFSGCRSLTSVTIPDSLTSIGWDAFYGCSSLTSVTIPNSVTSIEQGAFGGCWRLTSITIPSNVTYIGNKAFNGSYNISIVISLIENPFAITGNVHEFGTFDENTFNNATLYVPVGTKDMYMTTEGWKDFAHIEEGNPAGINVVENTKNSNTTLYDLNGARLLGPKKGINIVNGKKVIICTQSY